jgi:hypothetical protein
VPTNTTHFDPKKNRQRFLNKIASMVLFSKRNFSQNSSKVALGFTHGFLSVENCLCSFIGWILLFLVFWPEQKLLNPKYRFEKWLLDIEIPGRFRSNLNLYSTPTPPCPP